LPTHPPNQTQGTVGASTSVAAATAALPEVSALNILEALKLTSLLTAQKFPTSSDFVVSSSSKTKTRKPPLPLPDLSGVVSPSPDDADSFTPDAGTSKDDEVCALAERCFVCFCCAFTSCFGRNVTNVCVCVCLYSIL
jgi:hypothetical protein